MNNLIIGIAGGSGSGKTTLMNMIGCMDTPSKGSVMLEGRRLEDLNARQLAFHCSPTSTPWLSMISRCAQEATSASCVTTMIVVPCSCS